MNIENRKRAAGDAPRRHASEGSSPGRTQQTAGAAPAARPEQPKRQQSSKRDDSGTSGRHNPAPKRMSDSRTAPPPAAAKRSLAVATAERSADADAGSASGSDSEEHDGFVKVDRWKAPADPQLATFKPTIPPTGIPMFAPVAGTKGSRLISRVRGTLMASAPAAAAPAATPRSPAPQPARDADAPTLPRTPTSPNDAAATPAAAGESDSSCSDDDISDVLDETEIQLIEAMEDARIAGQKSKGPEQQQDAPGSIAAAAAAAGAAPPTALLPRRPLRFVGLGESTGPPRASFAESLKERFSASKTASTTTGIPTLRAAAGRNGAKGPEPRTVPDAAPPAPAARTASATSVAAAPEASAASLDAVQFVAPGVAKQTASSLLRRVLDIDAPVIQQKMVEFLLIDGVIASLVGFVTHCQDSIYSPSSSPAPAPGSPKAPLSTDQAPGAAHEAEQRGRRKARLMRQRNRSAGLTETDLRRGYNAVNMLVRDDPHAHRVLEAKISVIVPCLMAVFHPDSLGSFHHVCMLLEHCFALSPLKTTRLLLYQQNPPSRWWQHSESVAKGHAPICDILPYLSEPCVQRLFLKAEFGVWTGRLMVSLNLKPSDAMVVSDELSRMGLASVASALGSAPDDDSAAGKAQSQQRSKAMQLVRNRFQQLNRGGFLAQALEQIEDPDPSTSESVTEFLAYMINDCSTFYGFNILFKPIYDSELPVRRLAQLIINSPSQRLTLQAKSATRLLHALLSKTSCQYGLRTRDAQGIRDQELHPRGSQVMVHIGHAVRAALESFLPGLLATVAGQQESTDLTSHSACNRRASVQSLQLPEYDEAEREHDVDLTEAAVTSSASSDAECSDDSSADSDLEPAMPPLVLGERQRLPTARPAYPGRDLSSDNSDRDSDDGRKDADLRSSAAALLQSTYPDSISSGSVSSSLSPSSTLSASPMAIASSTPERPLDTRAAERMDAEDLDLLATLPKPDLSRLHLLRVCIEVLRECRDVDEVVGWVDLRVWRALGAWFINHPHNNLLHMSVYQLLSIVTLEAVRLRRARRMQQGPGSRAPQLSAKATKADRAGYRRPRKLHSTDCYARERSSLLAAEGGEYLSADAQSSGAPEPPALLVAKRRALRRRAVAEQMRREEASSCDNVLTYLVDQLRWIDKLVRRASSPNFDGAHGYISLILNTLRLAVQVDRRRCFSATAPLGKAASAPAVAQHTPAGAGGPESECSDSEAMLPDLAYHDPATRERLSEYPLYRLQRWEITLLYSPAFRGHLRALRRQALLTARKIVEFRLCDQSHKVILSESEGTGKRPVPFFSPQKVRPPQLLDNADLKKKQLQINVGLLLGGRCPAALLPSSSKASSSAGSAPASSTAAKSADNALQPIDEVGVNLDSLYARMLGFTEDLAGPLPPPPPPAVGGHGATKGDKAAATAAGAYLGAGADAASDEESEDRGHDNDHHGARARKCGGGGHSKAGSMQRKKSRPAAATPVGGLFEDLAPESATEAAEALCSALAGDGGAGSAASRHAPSGRARKKAVAASGSVRRRRARLQRRSSASSLKDAAGTQTEPGVAPSPGEAAAAAEPDTPLLPSADAAPPVAASLSHSMQSLDIEP